MNKQLRNSPASMSAAAIERAIIRDQSLATPKATLHQQAAILRERINSQGKWLVSFARTVDETKRGKQNAATVEKRHRAEMDYSRFEKSTLHLIDELNKIEAQLMRAA